jgi:hypothetical protein
MVSTSNQPIARRLALGCTTATVLLALTGCSNAPVAARSPSGYPAGVAASTALAALENVLRSYERESLEGLQALLPATFVGRAIFIDNAKRTLAEQSQIRVQLSEVKTGSDNTGVHTVQARWDKRFLKTQTGQAALESGVINALLRQHSGLWVVDVINPDNPFVR